MDFQQLDEEATRSLQRLPRDLLQGIATLILAHKDALVREFPLIIEDLKPHCMAAIMEGGMGILDKNELEATLMRVLAKFGVEMPADTAGMVLERAP